MLGTEKFTITSTSTETSDEYTGDGLAGAMYDYQQRAYPVDAIYRKMMTTNPKMRDIAMKKKGFMYAQVGRKPNYHQTERQTANDLA
eukprot:3934871-Rhodomonas_salina.1